MNDHTPIHTDIIDNWFDKNGTSIVDWSSTHLIWPLLRQHELSLKSVSIFFTQILIYLMEIKTKSKKTCLWSNRAVMYAFGQCLFRSLDSNHENAVLEANGWYTRYLFFKTKNISCYLYCNEGRFKRNSKKYNCFLFFKKKKHSSLFQEKDLEVFLYL